MSGEAEAEKRLLRGGEQRLAKPWLALQQPWLALVCESRAVSAEEDESGGGLWYEKGKEEGGKNKRNEVEVS